jgi:DNA-binding protein
MAQDNTVFVGSKPPMNYVLAVITQFHNGAKKVEVKARGRAISRAVDVAEIVRNKFMGDLKIGDISIGTEELQGEKGDKLNVSTMTILLEKGKEDSKKK